MVINRRGAHEKVWYIKNILNLSGYDALDVMCKLKSDTIKELKGVVKDDVEDMLDDQNLDITDYYNNLHKCKGKFKFVQGHIFLLEEIGSFARDYIDLKKEKFG